MRLIFDMDGPLVESRQQITTEMSDELEGLYMDYDMVLISGSTEEQIRWQLGDSVSFFSEVHAESGGGEGIPQHEIERVSEFMSSISTYRDSQSDRVQLRENGFNWSAAGQSADQSTRDLYRRHFSWERITIAARASREFPQYRFLAGGSVSIDVHPRGVGKESLPVLPGDLFFCDSLGPLGGDSALAERVSESGEGCCGAQLHRRHCFIWGGCDACGG